MFKLEPYLLRMTIFLAAAGLVAGTLYPSLARAFMANAPLNGTIFGVLLLGIVYAFRQVVVLRREAAWISAYRRRRESNGRSSLTGRRRRNWGTAPTRAHGDHARRPRRAHTLDQRFHALITRFHSLAA